MCDGVKRWRAALAVGVCLLFIWGSAGQALAQSEGAAAIAGTVLDPDGRPVADAAVLIRSDATGDTHVTTTDASGHFAVGSLAALCASW